MFLTKKTHYILILGQRWNVVFWHPDHYAKNIALDSQGELTNYSHRKLNIDLEYLSTELMRHELTHAYAKERSIVEVGINKNQLEEFFAEIIGKHGELLCRQAKQLYQYARKLKWQKNS